MSDGVLAAEWLPGWLGRHGFMVTIADRAWSWRAGGGALRVAVDGDTVTVYAWEPGTVERGAESWWALLHGAPGDVVTGVISAALATAGCPPDLFAAYGEREAEAGGERG